MKIEMKSLCRVLLATALTGVLFACNKNNAKDNNTQSDADLQTQSDDQARVSTESDAAFDDVNTVMVDQTTITGASDAPTMRYGVVTAGMDTVKKQSICDAVVTIDTTVNPRKLVINYNGKAGCNLNRIRTGTVTITMAAGTRWKDAGAQVTVTFDLTIKRVSDGKSIKLTGAHLYTNVTGGNVFALSANTPGPIVHTVTSSNMAITFDNGAQRTWQVARKRTYTYNGGLVVTLDGTHTEGNVSGISEWGTNRFGNSFTTSITQSLVVKQSCSWQLTAGQLSLVNAAGSTVITFGLDANGAATGCPVGSGTYYYKLAYTSNANKTYTFILPY